MKHTLRHVKNKNNQEKKLCLVFYKGSLVNYVGMLVGGIYLVNNNPSFVDELGKVMRKKRLRPLEN